jgi:2-methylcitrate dehydratase PrpD
MRHGQGGGVVTRRGLLQTSGAAVAAGLLPRAARAAASQSPVMARLSAYMAEAAGKPLPEAVAERGKQAILDTLAAMISGSELAPGKIALKFAAAYRGDRTATVAASDILCGPVEAALVNGMLAHSDETDDTHPPSLSHPGSAVVPAALASGETFGGSGERFLRAVALGYDIGPRVTMTLGKIDYMAATHRSTHAIAGTFGAAAAAGSMAGLSAQQMRWLLSYTAQQASGIASWQRDTQHIEKSFDFAGMAARNGVTAALLVQAGGTGLDDVFTGADNFWDAFGPMNDPAMLIDGLGTRYELMRTDVKKWTVGSPIQAPLDALYNLMTKNGFDAEQVQKVVVRVGTHEASVVDNREIPDISLQHMMAVMLLDKTASFKAAHDVARMKDPAVLRQRAKVQLIGDEELEKLLPKRVAVVEVTLNGGKTLHERVDTVRGTVGNPMPRSEIVEKARDLIAPVLGAETFRKLTDTVFGLEKLASVRDLRPLIRKG